LKDNLSVIRFIPVKFVMRTFRVRSQMKSHLLCMTIPFPVFTIDVCE